MHGATTLPTVAEATAHPEGHHNTQNTHYSKPRSSSRFDTTKMAPYFGHGARRTAYHNARDGGTPHVSSTNVTQPGGRDSQTSAGREHDRARQIQQKRDRREYINKMVLPFGQGPICDYHDGDSRRAQRDRILQQRVVLNNEIGEDGGSVLSNSLDVSQQGKAEFVNDDVEIDTSVDVDDFSELFGSDSPPPRPSRQQLSTKPVQYGSSHHLPFNLNLHPLRSVQAATRTEPIRMLNTFNSAEPEIDGVPQSSAADDPPAPTPTAVDTKKHPINTYKGSDPIKKLVQNKKLQFILMGRPLPKPRKKADRMVLKCTGRQEFR